MSRAWSGQAEQAVAFYCAGTRSALSVGSMSVASGIVQLAARGESEKDCVSGPGYHEPLKASVHPSVDVGRSRGFDFCDLRAIEPSACHVLAVEGGPDSYQNPSRVVRL